MSENGISWASPIGWAQATETYYSNEWYPVGMLLATALVLVAIVVPLSRRRDVGAGIFGTRPGPAHAGGGLRGSFGLAWRLNRGVVIGWSVAVLSFGLAYGPVLSEADSFLEDLPIMAEFLPDLDANGVELFASLVIAIAAVLCAVPSAQVVLRLRTEEIAGRAGPVLATPVSRVRWALCSVALALITALTTLASFGLGMGLGAGLSLAEMSWVGESITASVTYFPAIAVIVALGVFLFGLAPRAVGATWVAVVYAVIVLYFGGLLNLPQWAMNISPFTHVPQLPAGEYTPAPMIWLLLVATMFVGAGLLGLRRRDIAD